MAYTRSSGVLVGNTIELYAIFTDAVGNLVDADALPVIYFYDPTVEDSVFESELDALTFTSATAGPFTATRLSLGYYKYSYAVAPSAEVGTWRDVWVAQVEGVQVANPLVFNVSETIFVGFQPLGTNTMVIIELDASIAGVSGATLGEDISAFFTTTYSPLYASPDLVRLEIGKWIDHIPDDTLALMCHWASKEADFIHGGKERSSSNLQFAKTKFVVYDSALKCLLMPGGGVVTAAESMGGGKKQLGDLLIQGGGTVAAAIPDSTLDWLRKQREEWFRVVNAGANIVPGGGGPPQSAIKGLYDPNRRATGRLWADPREYYYHQPATNGKMTVFGPDGNPLQKKRLGFRRRYV